MAILKKDIIQGKELVETIRIDALEQDVDLRPLTDGEYNEVEAIRKDLGKIRVKLNKVDKSLDPEVQEEMKRKALEDQDVNMDLGLVAKKGYEANARAAAYGLSNSGFKWTVDEVKKLKAGAVPEIARAVYKISHLDVPETLEKEIDSFRK